MQHSSHSISHASSHKKVPRKRLRGSHKCTLICRNSQELAQSAPHSSCYSLFSSYKSAFDRYRYALSRILSSFINTAVQARCQLRPKHPTTKETIDEIPETTLASIAATHSSWYHRHRFIRLQRTRLISTRHRVHSLSKTNRSVVAFFFAFELAFLA